MQFDITSLLESWEYRSGQIAVRKIKAKDGTEKIQLRVDLGLLQMNAEGRPDGKLPFGHESLLEYYEGRLQAAELAEDSGDRKFVLTAEDCAKLLQEAIQFHHRYICLFQLQDFAGVIRDTDRNLRVFDFVRAHAVSEETSWTLQQFRAQLLMMRTRALGCIAVATDDYAAAMDEVRRGISLLREFYTDFSRADQIDQSSEIQSLESWLAELSDKRPLSAREKLENALRDAVQREDYELAAKYRDSLRNLDMSTQ